MGIIFEDIQSGNESSIDIESVSMESTAGGKENHRQGILPLVRI
jgi:hypothetical protein